MFDQPVFARVIGDHGENSTWVEPVAQEWQRLLERSELVVHGDADGLEEPRKIAGTHARAEGASNCVDEIVAYTHRFTLTATRDFPSKAVGPRLVSVVAKNV